MAYKGLLNGVPFKVWLAHKCLKWKRLPSEILAQPHGLLDELDVINDVLSAYASFDSFAPGQGASWQRAHQHEFEVVEEIEAWLQNDSDTS